MGSVTGDDLDGIRRTARFPDGALVTVFCRRTTRDVYPSGWAYKLHYGPTDPDPPRTLGDGTIRRYDNAHEATKGHELHVPPNLEPTIIEFPGMVELWNRFWNEIPKPAIDPTDDTPHQ
jgi:hypothetical protein